MSFLLDTHVLLWAASTPERLPADVRMLIENRETELVFSVDPRLLHRELLENDYTELAVTGVHAAAVDLLPPIHRDPFDRILVAQARVEGMTLLMADEVVGRYPGPIKVF